MIIIDDKYWREVLIQIKYQFNYMGTSSMAHLTTEFGQLDFHWYGNKSKIRISFVNTCPVCLCEKPSIASCNCDWLAFQEGDAYPSKIFTKSQVYEIIQPTLFDQYNN